MNFGRFITAAILIFIVGVMAAYFVLYSSDTSTFNWEILKKSILWSSVVFVPILIVLFYSTYKALVKKVRKITNIKS